MILVLPDGVSPQAADAFAVALDVAKGDRTVAQTGTSHFRVVEKPPLSDAERAAILAVADAYGADTDPPRGAASRLWAVLSRAQRAVPLDELVWDTLRGVAESLTFDGEYCTRRVYFRADDIGGGPLIDVRYQYEIRGGRVVSDTSTIAYPYTDGGGLTVEGQVYVRDYPAPALGDGKTPPDGTLDWSTE